uniref:Peptidase A2 domain-containing protein n=1 Tax=Strongyloides papillosus TaxID=174720 RepID=A0A0N5BSE5_STREA
MKTKCYNCNSIGDTVKFCKKKVYKIDIVENDDETKVFENYKTYKLCLSVEKKFVEKIEFEKGVVKFMIDSGSDVSIVNEATYETHIDEFSELRKPTFRLLEYNGSKVEMKGVAKCEKIGIDMIVVFGDFENILGRNYMKKNKWFPNYEVNQIQTEESIIKNYEKELVKKYPRLFENNLGCVDLEVEIKIKKDKEPKFFKTPRKIPYGLEEATKNKIDRMISNGILEKIENPRWGSPMCVVLKGVDDTHTKPKHVAIFRAVLSKPTSAVSYKKHFAF